MVSLSNGSRLHRELAYTSAIWWLPALMTAQRPCDILKGLRIPFKEENGVVIIYGHTSSADDFLNHDEGE